MPSSARPSLTRPPCLQWDLAFPESFRAMFEEDEDAQTLTGPDVVFAPICWYATDAGHKGLRWNQDSEGALLDSL